MTNRRWPTIVIVCPLRLDGGVPVTRGVSHSAVPAAGPLLPAPTLMPPTDSPPCVLLSRCVVALPSTDTRAASSPRLPPPDAQLPPLASGASQPALAPGPRPSAPPPAALAPVPACGAPSRLRRQL